MQGTKRVAGPAVGEPHADGQIGEHGVEAVGSGVIEQLLDRAKYNLCVTPASWLVSIISYSSSRLSIAQRPQSEWVSECGQAG